MRPLNGTPAKSAPVVLTGWNGKEPRVNLQLWAGHSFSNPKLIEELMDDLQKAYAHLMAGSRE